MGRLTKVDAQGRLLAYSISDTGLPTIIKNGNPYHELIERLKLYEDTGLEPEQIQQVDILYLEKCKEITALKAKSSK